MHWNIFKNVLPLNGQSCIVKRIINDYPHYEICTFMHFGIDYTWVTSKHLQVRCNENDRWYSVDSMIYNVEARLLSEIDYAINS